MIDQEPIYDYVPGKGWQIKTTRTFKFRDTDTLYKIVQRPPKEGEHYCTAIHEYTMTDWEEFVDGIRNLRSFNKYTGRPFHRDEISVMVLVPE